MRDYRHYENLRERAQRRAAQDRRDDARHAMFDLQAQDKTAKFERPQFAVVGEGSKSANENYRRGYESINWR